MDPGKRATVPPGLRLRVFDGFRRDLVALQKLHQFRRPEIGQYEVARDERRREALSGNIHHGFKIIRVSENIDLIERKAVIPEIIDGFDAPWAWNAAVRNL